MTEDIQDKPRSPENHSSTATGFLIGAVVGAGLALLLAPARGRATRHRLAAIARRAARGSGEAPRAHGTPL